jgi:hypothetical protein
MRLAGSDSWKFDEPDSQMLESALYTRDAANLVMMPAADIPPALDREVPRRDELVRTDDRDLASHRWVVWWRRLIDQVAYEANHGTFRRSANAVEQPGPMDRAREDVFDPPDFRSLADMPALRAAVVATYLEGRWWFSRRTPHLPSGDYYEVDGRWWFRASEPGSHELQPVPHDPSEGSRGFERRTIRYAAERTAEEHGVPLGQVRAVVHVLDVQGLWSYLPSPGCAICSSGVPADPEAAERLLLEAFGSSVRKA